MTTDLVIRNADDIVNPATGEMVDLSDTASVAETLLLIQEAVKEHLHPLERRLREAIYERMDAEGRYTLHLPNGLTVDGGQSRSAWENQTTIDGNALWDDLYKLHVRSNPLRATDAHGVLEWELNTRAWVDGFFSTKRYLTGDGERRLRGMSGPWAESLKAHTSVIPEERRPSRRAPKVKR